MTNPKRYLVTAALPYANGLKHIGHLAGAYIPADIYARYLRAQKEMLYLFVVATNMVRLSLFRLQKKEQHHKPLLTSTTKL
jgi:hypothetical protein